MRSRVAIRIKDLILKGKLTKAEMEYINSVLDIEITRNKQNNAYQKMFRGSS